MIFLIYVEYNNNKTKFGIKYLKGGFFCEIRKRRHAKTGAYTGPYRNK